MIQNGQETSWAAFENSYGQWAADTVQMCTEGAHNDINANDLSGLIANTKQITERVQA